MTNFVQTDIKRRQLVLKDQLKRLNYKYIIYNRNLNIKVRYEFSKKLNKLNRTGSEVRVRNRCVLTGRSRSIYRLFRVSRIKFRELASKNLFPGVTKASW